MATAIAKFIRMSPRKLRRVVNEIRGKNTHEATAVLKFMPYAAARVVEKVLKSAVANASHNDSLDQNTLQISKAYVDQSTTLKRWRAMSRGRGYPILKKMSHVTIEVTPSDDIKESRFTPKTKQLTHKHTQKHQDHSHDHGHDHDHGAKTKGSKKTESTKTKKTKVKEEAKDKPTKTKKTTKKEDKE